MISMLEIIFGMLVIEVKQNFASRMATLLYTFTNKLSLFS